MKIVTIVGARPQFIKAAIVSRAFHEQHSNVHEILLHTGQHYDANMSDIFFEEMAIPKPKYNLGIYGGSHGAMTGRQLEKIEEVLLAENPDWVLVYGDTNSTLAGALGAVKLHIPVAHIEAGLRSFNREMPEEINRVLTDHISTLLFVPTENSKQNLLNEGIAAGKIKFVGDVMYDAALFYKTRASKPNWFDAFDLETGNYVLCTIHRAENTDEPARLRSILQGLMNSGLPVIMPLHPRTRGKLINLDVKLDDNLFIVEPVGYFEMAWLEMNCRVIATDSGGVQKEAYFHGKPCVTLRDETEWVELVEIGVNSIVGSHPEMIASRLTEVASIDNSSNIYGTGNSAQLITKILAST